MKADVEPRPFGTIELAGCDTVAKLFHHRVGTWSARTALREKRLCAIEHISGLGLAITGLVADIERGHDGAP